MRITLDRSACSGHALCAATAPHVFELDNDGFCLPLIDGFVPTELEQEAVAGVEACPEQALRVAEGTST